MSKFNVEFTDTFGGEANYCWVNRFQVEAKDIRQAITKAKQERYHAPVPRHRTSDYGDMVRIDIVGECVCAFITYADDEPEEAPAPVETPVDLVLDLPVSVEAVPAPKLNYLDTHIELAERHSVERLRGVKQSTNTICKREYGSVMTKKKAYGIAKKYNKFYRKLVKIKKRLEKGK